MKQILLILGILVFSTKAYSIQYCRTNANGNFTNPSIWEVYNGVSYVPLNASPTNGGYHISIEHIITLNTDVQLDDPFHAGAANFVLGASGTLIIENNHKIYAEKDNVNSVYSNLTLQTGSTIEIHQTGGILKFLGSTALHFSFGAFRDFRYVNVTAGPQVNVKYYDAGVVSNNDKIAQYGLLYISNAEFTFSNSGAVVNNFSCWNNSIVNINSATTLQGSYQMHNSTFNLHHSLTFSCSQNFESLTSTFTSGADAELHYVSNNGGQSVPPFPTLKKLVVNISQGQYLTLKDDLKITSNLGLQLIKGDVLTGTNKLILEDDTPIYHSALSMVWGTVSIKVETASSSDYEFINFPIGVNHTAMPIRVNLSTNGIAACYLSASVFNTTPMGTVDGTTIGGSMNDRYYTLKVEQTNPNFNTNTISNITTLELNPTGILPALNSKSLIGFSVDNMALSYQGITSSVSSPYISSLQLNSAQIADLGSANGSFIGIAQKPLTAGIYCVGASASYTPATNFLPYTFQNASNPYNSIDEAFDDLELRGCSGNITFELQNNYTDANEPNPIVIVYKGNSTHKATVRVRTDLVTPRNLSMITTDSRGILHFDGASYVSFIGSMNAFSCSTTKGIEVDLQGSSNNCITFKNGANNITIKDLTIKSFANSVGINFLSNGVLPTENISIECNNFRPSSTVTQSNNAITVSTSLFGLNDNKNIAIINNTFDNFSNAINLVGAHINNHWEISDNSFYNSSTTTSLSSFLTILPTEDAYFTINGNYFGGSTAFAGGSAMNAIGLYSCTVAMNATSNNTSAFSNNHFYNLYDNSGNLNSFNLLRIQSGGWVIDNNELGNPTHTNDITSTVNVDFRGIKVDVVPGDTRPVVISNNSINNINFTFASPIADGDFYGIYADADDAPLNIHHNTIKNIVHGAGLNYYLAYANSSSTDNEFKYNIAENIDQTSTSSGNNGFYINGSNWEVVGNRIGHLTNNNDIKYYVSQPLLFYCGSQNHCRFDSNMVTNVKCYNTGTYQNKLMQISSSALNVSCAYNEIRNISLSTSYNTTNLSTGASGVGLELIGAGNFKVHHNIVQNITLSNNTTTSIISLLGINVKAKSRMYNNEVYKLFNLGISTPTLPIIIGININQTDTLYNNIVSLRNNPNTNDVTLYGIRKLSTVSQCIAYHNTVNIGGSDNVGKSYAFYKNQVTNTQDTFLNNIFYNSRTGGGIHVAAGSGSANTNAWGMSNYNNTYASNSSQVMEYGSGNYISFPQWQAATNKDVNTKSVLTYFESINNNDLHITQVNCQLNGAGISIPMVVTDIDGESRNNPPDIGADEFDYTPMIVTATATNNTVCEGQAIGLQSTSNSLFAPLTYSWTGPNSYNYSGQNQNIGISQLANQGTYTVVVTDNYGCSASSTVNVIVSAAPTWYHDMDNDSYHDGSTIISCASPGPGYVLYTNGVDCDDSNDDIFPGATEICNNNIDDNCNGQTDENCNLYHTLAGNVFIQGYYIGNGQMNTALLNQGEVSSSTITDSITVELRNELTTSTVEYTSKTTLGTDGEFTIIGIPPALIGNSYYMVIKHRNSIETWSQLPINITTYTYYDFSTAATQAYGGNQYEVEPDVWALYSGDINQDWSIDAFDYILLDPDIIAGAFGYVDTDVTGDGVVDAFDYIILDGNLVNGVGAVTP
jgi:hypothetical protein